MLPRGHILNMEFSKAKLGGIVAATAVVAYGVHRRRSGSPSDPT